MELSYRYRIKLHYSKAAHRVRVDLRQLMIYFANTFNTGIDKNISLAGLRLFSSNSVNTCQKIASARPLEELSS
jgi:hypothetical protein